MWKVCHNSIEYVEGCRDKCLSWNLKMEIDYDLGCVHLGCIIHEHLYTYHTEMQILQDLQSSKLLQKPTARWEMANGSLWYSNLSDQESDWLNCGMVYTATIIYYGSTDKIKSDQICQAVKKTDCLLLPKLRWPSFPGCNWRPLSSSSRQKST